MIGILRILCAQWTSFLRLSASQKFLTLEAALWLFLSMLLVKLIRSRYWLRYLGTKDAGDHPVADPGQESIAAREIAQAIRRINRVSRGRFTCLMEAIAGKVMLNRRGVPNTLVLGVRTLRDDKEGMRMEAHAWLKCGQVILLGGEVHQSFTVVAQFQSPPYLYRGNPDSGQ